MWILPGYYRLINLSRSVIQTKRIDNCQFIFNIKFQLRDK